MNKDDSKVIEITTWKKERESNQTTPFPGSDEWTRGVLNNVISLIEKDEKKITLFVNQFDQLKLNLFVFYILGDLIDLLLTPVENYHARGKQYFESFPENEDKYEDWITYVIFDLCVLVGKEKDFFNSIFPITKGQLWTFWSTLMNSATKVLSL